MNAFVRPPGTVLTGNILGMSAVIRVVDGTDLEAWLSRPAPGLVQVSLRLPDGTDALIIEPAVVVAMLRFEVMRQKIEALRS